MAGQLQKVRFKVSWQTYRVGDEITPNASLRGWLIDNGYCELLPEKRAGVTDKSKVLAQAPGAVLTR